MSICRTGRDSDVYIYRDTGGGYTLHYDADGNSHYNISKTAMREQLSILKARGFKLEPGTIDYFDDPETEELPPPM